MHESFFKTAFLIVSFFCPACVLAEGPSAFPGAEGYGKYTVGGRGGAVYEVGSHGFGGIWGSNKSTVGGWPELKSGAASADTGHHGMPDTREAKKGLDPKNPADGAVDPDGDGYTNLEHCLNWLAGGSPAPARSLSRAAAATDPAAAEEAPDDSDRPTVGRGGALDGHRHRVLVSTDIGGTDPDDFQSMVHLLLYADVFDIEGLISSPYGPGRKADILDVIDSYAKDYVNLKSHSDRYPAPDALRALTKQGETERAPYAGVRRSTEGSDWIIHCARRNDRRPLSVLVWGGIEDLAQALHGAPDILPKLRVYWIGGPNKKWSPDAFQYIVEHFPKLWMIECNATYRGWFVGGDQSGEWGNKVFVSRHITGKGALGRFFVSKKVDIKMGDTPSVGWLLKGTPEDPSRPGWGGRFVRAPERPFFRFERLTTRDDRIDAFSILELALPMGTGAPEKPEARLVVENQSLIGHVADDGTMRFRFCPKAVKEYRYRIRSNVPALDGKTGDVTAVPVRPDGTHRTSEKHPNWWTDDPTPKFSERGHIGAKTVNRWRVEFLRDFAVRMQRCQRPKPTDN